MGVTPKFSMEHKMSRIVGHLDFFKQLRMVFAILSRQGQMKVKLIVFAQSMLSLVDLFAVLLVGTFVSNSLQDPNKDSNPTLGVINLEKLNIFGLNFNFGFATIFLAILLLLLKTVASITITKIALKFFSNEAARISGELISFAFSGDLQRLQKKPLQEVIFSTTRGVECLTIQVLATCTVMIGDFALLSVLTMGLLLVDLQTALATILLFGSALLILNNLLGKKSTKLGNSVSNYSIASGESIENLYYSFREMFVKNKIDKLTMETWQIRKDLSLVLSKINFMPYIGKYVIETTLVVGGLLLALIAISTSNLYAGLSVLSVFITSGSRVVPAIMRLQQSYLTVLSNMGMAASTLSLMKQMRNFKVLDVGHPTSNLESIKQSDFSGNIEIADLHFCYENLTNFSIYIEKLEIRHGESIAIVGPSGSGKSTLVDLMLGLLTPMSGTITISGISPRSAIKCWPGKISYVPQNVHLFRGTLRDNLILGFEEEDVVELDLDFAVNSAALAEFIDSAEDGIRMKIGGGGGARLSGGQAQRVGIARALITSPRLVIFDEATSSLDASTENIVTKTLETLKGKSTVITIAHRLSTVVNADKVIYLEDGRIKSIGTFETVRREVPNFDNQALLMGLN
jgi:ABC-type bacteriocin/lantibiotic exporter with double-glycine peptidase domain